MELGEFKARLVSIVKTNNKTNENNGEPKYHTRQRHSMAMSNWYTHPPLNPCTHPNECSTRCYELLESVSLSLLHPLNIEKKLFASINCIAIRGVVNIIKEGDEGTDIFLCTLWKWTQTGHRPIRMTVAVNSKTKQGH